MLARQVVAIPLRLVVVRTAIQGLGRERTSGLFRVRLEGHGFVSPKSASTVMGSMLGLEPG
jgi:hypothetical protein